MNSGIICITYNNFLNFKDKKCIPTSKLILKNLILILISKDMNEQANINEVKSKLFLILHL